MNSKRLSLITATLLVVIFAFGASTAQANTYCANLPAATPDAACSTNRTNPATAVQTAVEDAKNNPGPDTVLIGPGAFTSPNAMDLYGSGTDNTVTIIGSGSGTDPASSTILSVSNQAAPTITFDAGAGSSISDLSFFINASSTPGGREGLLLRNSFDGEPPTATNLNIYSNPNAYLSGGVVLYSGSDIENSSVDVSSTNYTVAVKAEDEGSDISRSYLAGNTGAVQSSTNGSLSIYRSEIQATGFGLKAGGGFLNVSDSFIQLSSGNAQVAVEVTGSNTGHALTAFQGSTIIANAGAGIRVQASQGSSQADLYLDSSVLAGPAGTIEVNAANSDDSTYFGSFSGSYDSTKLSTPGNGTIVIDPQEVVDLGTTSPGFVDAANGNYRLAPASALIDAGQALDPPEGALDYEGNPRACHGTDSGVIRRDIGAFEFKTDPNDDCTYPVASISPDSGTIVDLTPTFTLTSDKAGTEFLCSIDDEPYLACTSPFTTPTLTAGNHSLDVRAKDTFGNIAILHTRAAFTIEAPPSCATDQSLCPPPTCETDPSLCPDPPDTTAPKVIGVKAMGKTKGNRVKVQFKSNEIGVTFTCKLNNAKAKRCKSPWKTPKLKEGKNTIALQATDTAGNKSKIVKRFVKKLPKRK